MAREFEGFCKIKNKNLSLYLVGLLVNELISWRVDKKGGVWV